MATKSESSASKVTVTKEVKKPLYGRVSEKHYNLVHEAAKEQDVNIGEFLEALIDAAKAKGMI